MMTPAASRAARGLLGWSLQDLAHATGLTYESLSRFENGRVMRDANAAKIAQAFEVEGIELIIEADRTGAVLVHARKRGGDDQ
ncbi:helix-turn-helix domain-containing protein [Brevundimonas subvibrioides]|uniref:helix-turn-helix domain-containing protein n=1 Tax=Brevundimonas subvibrioides TaxID=74313 RepID=UPI0022B4DCD2|nr:helix-turn-helix transcriptional regulator [Brevundimonas subvibrioides]